jgi:hypothetical protein
MARYFHRTTRDAADAILTSGFRDGRGSYMFVDGVLEGVWISNVPADANEGASGDVLLAVDVDADLVAPYAVIEEGKPAEVVFREFIVPAQVLNAHAQVVEIDEQDL